MGDIALPCFRLSKALRRSPVQIADMLAANIQCDEFASVTAVNGYLNFKINGTAFSGRVVGEVLNLKDKYGSPMNGEGKTVVLDYSSPNVAKPFHIGHLGTTVIGHSLKLLHEFAGYKCVGINYLGDWGTQFGKLIVAYKMWGDKATIEAGGVDELVKLYVRINNEIKAEEEANGDKKSPLADASRGEFTKLEQGDEENLALWRWFVDVSLEEYQKTYKLLGIEFDKENLWMKAQHEGALSPPCIIQKNPQVTNTVRQVVCHPVNNSRGTAFRTPTAGSLQSWDRRVRPRLV